MSEALVRYHYDLGEHDDREKLALIVSDEVSKLVDGEVSIDYRPQCQDWAVSYQAPFTRGYILRGEFDSVDDAVSFTYKEFLNE